MNIRNHLLGSLAVLAAPAAAMAVPIINVGVMSLEPNKANQVRQINVSGGDAVQGLNLFAQVADGGPEAAAFGGSVRGPRITSITVVGQNTTFGSNNSGQRGSGAFFPQLYEAQTTTNAGTVPASGVLAEVTFDTTGLTSGSYPLLLSGTLLGDTDFAGVPATITNGTLNVVPVPEPTVAGAAAAVGLLAAAGRRRRCRGAAGR